MASRPVVIAGAGIGGLTAALALAARGHEVIVCERAERLDAIGAGVQLSPNASRILIRLGLRDALAPRAFAPDAVILNSVRAGGELQRLRLPQDRDAPYWVIHRAALQATLAGAALARSEVSLRLGCEVAEFATHEDRLGVRIGDQTIEADALIGADGVGSRIRQALFPDSAERDTGRAAWRGLAASSPSSAVQLWMGPDAHLVAYPVERGARTNLVVTLPDDAGDGLRAGASVAAQLAQAGWPAAACALVGSAQTLTRYPLRVAPPLAAWTAGRVALLGDSAHAMPPFAAQGAAMAIEDAAVLAGCFDAGDVAASLAQYAARRSPRAAQVARAALQSGRIYHLAGPMALARDLVIRTLGGERLRARQDWIYDWRP